MIIKTKKDPEMEDDIVDIKYRELTPAIDQSLFKFSARVGFCGKFDAPQGKNMQFY